jgi:hypothetical protein
MHARFGVLVALALLAASCRDEDISDEPVLPDNVDASVEECAVVDGRPRALVEVTNGTGHAARFDVTLVFVEGDRVRGSAVASSDEVAPGAATVLRFDGDGDTTAVDDCRIEDVAESRR